MQTFPASLLNCSAFLFLLFSDTENETAIIIAISIAPAIHNPLITALRKSGNFSTTSISSSASS
jgi:hypothetical protein